MNIISTFEDMIIIGGFRQEDLLKIPRKKIIAVVININPTSKEDRVILKKWEAHFQQDLSEAGLPTPYIITQNTKGIKTLWKERRA